MQDTGADAGPPWASIPQGNTGGLVLLSHVLCRRVSSRGQGGGFLSLTLVGRRAEGPMQRSLPLQSVFPGCESR